MAMAMESPHQVVLSDPDRRVLLQRARSARRPHREVLRAAIVLPPPRGWPTRPSPAGWASASTRCASGGPGPARAAYPGWATGPGPGRRRIFPATAEAEVKALACALPAETGVPLARWSCAELAAEAVARGVAPAVSASTVGRWLAADAIRPWRYRSWIFPRDPDFAGKAARVLELDDRTWHGQPLGGDEYVLRADEKSQLQALHQRRPDLPPAPDRIRRTEFEYRRRRHPGLSGGLRRERRPRARPRRADDRPCALRRAGGAGL